MHPIDWFALLHPVLVILFVYPVVGATIRLGILVREKRLGVTAQPAVVPREHTNHGLWITIGVVVAVLIAFVFSFFSATQHPTGFALRPLLLLIALAATSVILILFSQVKSPALRIGSGFLLLAGLLALGAQPEIWRESDNPFTAGFWGSHYWIGIALTGLLVFTTAVRSQISRHLRWRRIHVIANLLVCLLLAMVAITGVRDLLEIPLSWQKAVLERCDYQKLVCAQAAAAAQRSSIDASTAFPV